MALELQDVRNLCPAPAVDRLVVVADHADVRRLPVREQGDEIELEAVCVLEIIHHEVVETGPPLRASFRGRAQDANGEQEEVIEINGVHALEFGLVTGVDRADQRVLARHAAGGNAGVVLELGDERLRGVRVELLVLGGRARDDRADGAEAVALVVDREIRLPAEPLDVAAQDAHAQRVERGHR